MTRHSDALPGNWTSENLNFRTKPHPGPVSRGQARESLALDAFHIPSSHSLTTGRATRLCALP